MNRARDWTSQGVRRGTGVGNSWRGRDVPRAGTGIVTRSAAQCGEVGLSKQRVLEVRYGMETTSRAFWAPSDFYFGVCATAQERSVLWKKKCFMNIRRAAETK